MSFRRAGLSWPRSTPAASNDTQLNPLPRISIVRASNPLPRQNRPFSVTRNVYTNRLLEFEPLRRIDSMSP